MKLNWKREEGTGPDSWLAPQPPPPPYPTPPTLTLIYAKTYCLLFCVHNKASIVWLTFCLSLTSWESMSMQSLICLCTNTHLHAPGERKSMRLAGCWLCFYWSFSPRSIAGRLWRGQQMWRKLLAAKTKIDLRYFCYANCIRHIKINVKSVKVPIKSKKKKCWLFVATCN